MAALPRFVRGVALLGILCYTGTKLPASETAGDNEAGSNSIPSPFDLDLQPNYAADVVVPTQRAPLMAALDHFGLARPLDKAGINIYGVIEGSYTYNAADPHSFDEGPEHKIELRMYDHHSDQLILQRIDLFFDRFVNYHHADKWDVGGLVEFQYGHDGAMMHSNGLMDYRLSYIPANPTTHFPAHFANSYLSNEHSPYYQPDLTEAFIDVAAPVGNGLRIRTGKFATIMGYESCDPVHNQAVQFFSRSFILTFGIPMYQTGAYLTYDINDNITVNAGFSRGWEQCLKDNNDSLDFLGSVNYIVNDNFVDYVAVSEGPEQPDDNSHYRTVLEDIVYFTPNPRGPWNFALDILAGWEDNQVKQYFSFFPPAAGSTTTGAPVGNTAWYGIALFGGYRVNNNLQIKGRLEWFEDGGGSRFRFPEANREFTATVMNDSAVPLGRATDAYEMTIGLDWTPFPHDAPTLKLRPEVREDITSRNVLVDGHKHSQTTIGIDLLYRF